MGDAQSLVTNPYAILEDRADPQVPTATLQIYGFINAYLGRSEDTNVNRASAASMCFKRRWYKAKGFPATELTPRKIVNFLLGDLSERVLLYFIKQSLVGPGKLYSEVDLGEEIGAIHFQGKELKIYRQHDLAIDVGGIAVSGHADGWGKRNSDGRWELIEIKSSSDYGFKEFQESGPKDYLKQSHVLMKSDKAARLGATEVRFFYLKKQTGHLWDRMFSFDAALWDDVIAEYRAALSDKEPKAPYPLLPETNRGKATGNIVAKFPCTYCPYLEHCHGKYEIEWKNAFGSQYPVYVFNKGVKS